MSGFEVVESANRSGRARWVVWWLDSARREPAWHPTYAELFAAVGDRPRCALYEDAGGRILLPFIQRRIPYADGLEDATSPYGYGGPLVEGQPDADRFWHHFLAWATAEGLVSLVVRLALDAEMLAPWHGERIFISHNVVRRFGDRGATLLASYEHKVRKNVARAQREMLRVEVTESDDRLDEFCQLYLGTMQRRQASAQFHFSRPFFERIVNEMSGSALFAHVWKDDRLVSSELLLRSSQYLYSFLGGTEESAFAMRPNDYLKHAVIEWGTDHGMTGYVLGGGPSPDDGIFRYKKSFAPDGIVPFEVGLCVIRPEVHRQLNAAAELRARAVHADAELSPRFVPTYRAPALVSPSAA